ncbi:MAG: DUF429 domain-containing protein [Candidatus Bathyarchaeota archaeon]|nr:DUF429 domain-containing protein [Candidatus Bathyarchaeota archaeon]
MLEFKDKCVIGIDLAASSKNPTGWALLRGKTLRTALIYTDSEILENIVMNNPALIAIDAPLHLPKKANFFRNADKEMIRKGYKVFSPKLPAMQKLTLRAIKVNRLIGEKKYKTIEVHPTSTRKALEMPSKDWKAIQAILKNLGLKGELETRTLISHELDAATAALTAVLHLKKQTERLGDREEGYIIVPNKRNWRELL